MAPPSTSREATNLWLARIERGLRDEEGPALREWLKQAANRKSILESAQLWHGPEVYSLVASLVPAQELLPEKPRRSLYKLSIAAGVVAALGVIGVSAALGVTPWAYLRGERPSRYLMPTGLYATTVGQTQKVTLNDASEITLNTRTSILVAYSPSSRDVFLRHGEASFDVTPIQDRPFVVNVGQRHLRADRARFNVRLLPNGLVDVTVTEGQVTALYATPKLPDEPALRREKSIAYGEVVLSALDSALVGPHFHLMSRLEPTEADARIAWQRGLVVFKSLALPDALDEIDRYTHTRFVLGDEKLHSVRVGGQFKTGDVEGLLRTLREQYQIDSRTDAQGRVVLTPLPGTKS